jgi:hypothetical protein
MTEQPDTQRIDGHVFDSDGNPIGANLVLKRIEVDGETCLSVSGSDWFGARPGAILNAADDVQFCIPLTALPASGVWTVVGTFADNLQPYRDHADSQHQRWAEVVQADSADEAIEKVRSSLTSDTAIPVVAACLAGDVLVAA